jgi:hypothetical protein
MDTLMTRRLAEEQKKTHDAAGAGNAQDAGS